MKRKLLTLSFLTATALAAFAAFQTGWSFWIPYAVFLLGGPVSDLVILKIGSKNIDSSSETGKIRWIGMVTFLVASVLLTGILYSRVQMRFLELLSFVMMGVSLAGGINGIVMEIEDNAPGGFNNPTSEQQTGKKGRKRR
jgi:hypothetical protein